MNDKFNTFSKNMFKVGTPECAITFAVIAMVLALFFLLLGFWQTLLVAALILVGAFIGGVKDKKEWVRNAVNKLFPPRQNIPYREQNPEIEKAVKEVIENTKETQE